MSKIEVCNLSKQFERTLKQGHKSVKEEFYAVNNVSLQASSGEIIGILGPNGAGKTTLLRMLGLLMTPSDGEIFIYNEENQLLKNPIEKKRVIGYLSGNTKLYPRFSIREYLAFLCKLYGYSKEESNAKIEDIIRVLAMESFADNHIAKLSTGQTQRASIARCLIADPLLYILDEPTLGLDILSADTIIQFMKTRKEQGKIVLYSTHYLEEAEVLCDRIYIICDGQIAAHGTPDALMKQTGTSSLREAFHNIYDSVSKVV